VIEIGQPEVLEYLKQNKGRWINTRELSKALNTSISVVNVSLRQLRKYKFFEFRVMEKKCTAYEYRCK